MDTFFKYQGKMFVNIENDLGNISKEQPFSTTLLVFSPQF